MHRRVPRGIPLFRFSRQAEPRQPCRTQRDASSTIRDRLLRQGRRDGAFGGSELAFQGEAGEIPAHKVRRLVPSRLWCIWAFMLTSFVLRFVILARRRRVGGMVDLNYAITSNKHTSLRNLAMILTVSTGQQYIPYGCRIYLFKPLRPSTVFGVIANTPTAHLPFGHPNCAGPCAEMAKPLIHPAERFCQVFMIEDGELREEMASEAATWTPRLQFQNTCVQHVSRASPGFEASSIERNLDAILTCSKSRPGIDRPK